MKKYLHIADLNGRDNRLANHLSLPSAENFQALAREPTACPPEFVKTGLIASKQ
jgi:hypothetical protein